MTFPDLGTRGTWENLGPVRGLEAGGAMKGIIAVVMLALGIVMGFTAGLLIRNPSVVSHPRTLLQTTGPTACLEVIGAADDLTKINRDYLSLVRHSYLPMLQQQNGTQAAARSGEHAGQAGEAASTGPASTALAVDAMLAASQRLADLGDRTAAATARLDRSQVECRSRVDQ